VKRHPTQNVIRIVEELKEDAAQRRHPLGNVSSPQNSTHEDPIETESASLALTEPDEFNFDPSVPRLVLEKPLARKYEINYELDQLLEYEGEEFVYNAYRAILKRVPDEAGLANAVAHLHEGTLEKLDVLADLYFSRERKEKGVHIRGLYFRAVARRMIHVPILGSFFAPIYHLVRLPSLIRDQRRRDGEILRRQETIAAYVNEIVSDQLRTIGNVVQNMVQLLEDQRQTEAAVLARLDELTRYYEDRLNDEAIQRQQGFKDRELEIEDVRRVYNKYRTQVELTEKALKKEMEHLFRKHQEVKMELVYQGQRINSLAEPGSISTLRPSPAVQPANDRSLDAFFAAFDEHFRGNRQAVKDRLKQYLPVIREHGAGNSEAPIVDIACGRGEWLELLKEENLRASGVDVNQVLIEQCRALGLEATQADMTDHLRGLGDGSTGAVTAFHIVEHLSVEALIAFLDQTLRVLRSGGLLLLETPNPQNVLVGSCNFYFDPTHRNPIPKPVLKFLVESRGFEVIDTLDLNPSDEKPLEADSELAERFNEFFYGPMDYAVIARKL
jgi:2-polyprenyl-3-methyl-5-hydroxy-6-metoxy-1,4-benzoquinol methylase